MFLDYSVNLDPKAAGWSMARPATPIPAIVEPLPATSIHGESRVRARPAADGLPATRSMLDGATPQSPEKQRDGDSSTAAQSGPFTAQRLAQESEQEAEPSSDLAPLRGAATAAYLKARDSHIQIMRSIQTLDLRI